MRRMIACRRVLAMLIAVMFAGQVAFVGPAQAGMVATEAVRADAVGDERAQLRSYLERSEVREALTQQGVDPDEAMVRVAALSDSEIALLASKIETDPAGQGLGIIIVAGLVALIVLLVADLSGQSDVF